MLKKIQIIKIKQTLFQTLSEERPLLKIGVNQVNLRKWKKCVKLTFLHEYSYAFMIIELFTTQKMSKLCK